MTAPTPPCDAAHYPDRHLPLDRALGGGEITTDAFTFCLFAYADPDAAHSADVPGVGWTAVWAYTGTPFTSKITTDAGPLPEALRTVETRSAITTGDTGGQDGAGLRRSGYPLPDGRTQLGIRVNTLGATYGARIAFWVTGDTVTDISVLPWDDQAVWPNITTAVSSTGVAAVGWDKHFFMVDATGTVTNRAEFGAPVSMVWSPSGTQLITQHEDGRLWLWRPGAPPKALDTGDAAGPLLIAWSPDERRLLLGQDWEKRSDPSGICKIWLYDIAYGSMRELDHPQKLLGLYWQDPDHALVHLYGGGGGSSLERRLVATWEKVAVFDGRGMPAPDRKTLLIEPWSHLPLFLTFEDLVNGGEQTLWRDSPPGAPPGKYELFPAIFAPDSRRLAYAVGTGPDEPNLLRIATVGGKDESVSDRQVGWMSWAPGGGLLYLEQGDAQIAVKLDQHLLGSLPGKGRQGVTVWSKDGNQAAIGIDSRTETTAIAIARIAPPEVWTVPNSRDLAPVMWAGAKLLTLERPPGSQSKALWLIDPVTGERTPIK